MFNLRAQIPLYTFCGGWDHGRTWLGGGVGLMAVVGGWGGIGINRGKLMHTPGLQAQSLIWLGLEMRQHARHSGLIEDAPLPAWSIHYLWVFTNFNWHFYQLWMSVSDSATLGVSVLPLKMKILVKYNCLVLQSKKCTVGCRFLITFYMCDTFNFL